MSPGSSLPIIFDSAKDQKMPTEHSLISGANAILAVGKLSLRVSLQLSCLLPTSFLLVYCSSCLLPLVGPQAVGSDIFGGFVGKSPRDEETVLWYRSVFVWRTPS